MDRHSGAGPPQHMRGRPVSGKDVANANEYFEPFLNATTMKNILGYHRSMCEFLHLKPNVFPHFYPKLKSNLNSWRAKAVWKKFDLRASHKCYNKGKACAGTKVLVIGAGPCGLRTAIEAQLLGAKVVIVEKRDRLSRNNVLHLWPFVIEDLRMLGAKKFFGKFCAGAIDHISIRQLQCILLKVALLLGVEVHTEVSFVNLVEPSADQKTGWRAEVKPEDHPVAQYEFDVIIGADGKRNTLQGFKRKEFRGKLAIAITANFINKKTEAEARVEEISGVAFIFNQKFFKDLQDATRIDLENIVYYKDDTHYFVMTAKKASLLEKEVIKQDLADTEKLLAPDNVNRDKLYEYAREAAEFSTNYQMTDLEFAVNHYGQPDVAMFDFTSMYAAEYASKVVERNGSRLLMILVGDSLLEPFWPTGSGCARGFLSSLDAAWAIRSWSSGQYTPLDVLAERESIYRLLAQTTPDNLNKDWKAYTLDPSTRYPNLNKTVVVPHQTECLYDTDNKESVEKMKRASLNANIKHEHVSKKRRRGGVDNEVLLSWLTEQLRDHEDVIVTDIASVFQGGRALCAIIHHYRPDLLDYNAVKDNEPGKCNQLAMDILEKDLAIPPFMTGEEITSTQDNLAMTTYLTQVYYTFRGEIPHIKHPKLELTCDVITDMTSVTQAQARAKGDYDDVRVETRTDVIKCISPMNSVENFTQRVRNHKENKPMGRSATKFTQHNSRPASLPPASFPVIVEARESGELPEATKHSSFSIKSIKVAHQQQSTNNLPVSRPSSRHKRHADMSMQKAGSMERKQRKRRTLDRFVPSVEDRQKVLEEIAANRLDRHNKRKQHRQRQTEQFIKSMQMLQANAKPDKSEPFEDYSIFLYRQTAPKFEDRVKDLEKQFTYVPDYETKSGLKPLTNTNADEDIASKIKSLEDKWSNPQPAEKKPKDLLRAIGKIETSDWNIKQIEKKILENKLGKPSSVIDKERVPRWSKEEFKARQTKMENKHLDRQDSSEAKFADIDKNIKQLDLKLKEGNIRELGQNKVASITEKLVSKTPQEQIKTAEKPAQPKTVNLPSGSEFCHFCDKKVYLMERLSAEGRFFHNGCFKCQYCHTQLRLGSYMFDKDGQYGHRFFCSQHYGMPGELPKPTKITRKASLRGSRDVSRSPSKRLPGVAGVDLLDRVQTPERIEFSNLSAENISSDQEEPLSQMDEDEWTDKNFGASCNELDESDDDSSSSFSSDSDDEDVFDDALEQPATKEGTLKLAERWKKCYRKGMHSDSDGYSSSDHSSYYENSSDDSDSETATEGEEEIRARELRKQEVRVEPPVVQTDTGTDTEVKKNLDFLPPDILPDHPSSFAPLEKSPSNYSLSSEAFKSAESDLDYNMNKTSIPDPNVVVGKLTISKPPLDTKNTNGLARSATAGNLIDPKPKRNFVLPPKSQRKSVGELEPKFKLDEPLLVIRRTPSKVAMPKEIKPKVALNTKGLDTTKYFGLPKPPQRPKLQRADTSTQNQPKSILVKQSSLPETANEITEATNFNFDLHDSDLDAVDNYIEDLLAKKEELDKPVDTSKYMAQQEDSSESNSNKGELSNSIEDLLDALEKMTDAPHREAHKESEEKIEDLLNWMEELNHQTPERKVYRSVSDVKYKNLERLLKGAQKNEGVVSKLPKNNLSFFESILKGKEIPKDCGSDDNMGEPKPSKLCRSKTEVYFNRMQKTRSSVDLDAVKKVNIKSVLKKFESFDQEDEPKPKPERPIVKRLSLGSFQDIGETSAKFKKPPIVIKPKSIGSTIQKFENEPKEFKKVQYKNRDEPQKLLPTKSDEQSVEDTIKDLEEFVDKAMEGIEVSSKNTNDVDENKNDWCANITVSTKVSPEFLKMQEVAVSNAKEAEEKSDDLHMLQELKDFNDAMSVLVSNNTNKTTPEPHDFSKAVESTDTSGTEDVVEPIVTKVPDPEIPEVIVNDGNKLSTININDLYATVNKTLTAPTQPPPLAPQRNHRKHSHGELPGAPLPPPRAARQKSVDLKPTPIENIPPVAPQRRRSGTVSPMPRRKNSADSCELTPLNANGRSTSTGTLEVKPEVMVSDESSSETSSEIQNSATEISTDSEFAHDEPTPTRELPAIALNDVHVTKTRGSGAVVDPPRRIQVTSGFLQGPVGTAPHHAQFLLKPAPYALNRTQSTGGIATKVSLELKRRYLLGEGEANSIQKSGSASALDSKFKSFQSTISDCQRMLKPAVEPSASMQLFCSKLDERLSPSGPPPSLPPPDITITTITEQSSLSGDGAKQPNNSNERIDTVPMGDEQEQSTESSSSSEEAATTPNFRFESIPRVEVHAAKDSDAEEMALDSLCGPSPAPDQIKSVGSEKKELNQPKPLPNLEHILPDIHKVLHVRIKSDKEESPEDNKSIKTVSGKSSPDGTAALTETELSDWARDENVSDSIELDISQGSDKKKLINLAKLSEFEEAVNEYICPKDTTDANKKSILANDNDLDSIEYMDTGTETSSEDGIGNSQDGYVLFKNEDDLVDDSLNPQVNEILEARNIYLISTEKEQQHHQADLKKSSDLDSNVEAQNKQKPTTTEHEEDSLVVVDTGTTTEENTCSDSTVKNITEITKDMKEEKSRPSLKIEQFQKQRLEDKLAKVKAEQALIKDQMQQSNQKENIEHNIQFEEHCQRLQSKVEFGNAKDSIDIRKSRRKSKSDSPHKPDLIREEKERPSPPKDITLNLNPVIRPDILYKKENIKKERDVNQKLIQEMVMNKMKAENKSLERRRRSRGNLGSLSPCRPYPIQKSSTTDVVSQTNLSNVSKNDSIASSTYATPDLLSNSMALKHSQSTDTVPGINSSNENYETPMASTPPKQNISKPLSVFSETRRKNETPLTTTDNYSMPDIRKQLFLDEFKTPKAPPRYNRPSIIRTAEKMKEDARARVRLLSNEDLGLSPEDKLNKLRERVGKKSNRASDDLDIHVQESIESLVLNTERRNSLLYPNDTLTKKRNNSFRRSMSGDSAMPTKDLSVSECRPKSISGIPKNLSLSKSNNIETDTKKACKSDPNLLDTHGTKKKSKDRERRKSITKLIAGIFAKKTPSANSTTTKGLFAKLSPKSKTTSKSLSYLDLCKHETPIEESTRRKSLSENNIQKRDPSPPPIPPLPVNYSVKATDESSDGDNVDCKHAEQGSCDTLDQSVNLETSISSMTSSRRSLKARKISRQAQLKRHRMAQEIQRKLEETEVKTRELEQRGVHVEKSLRGENGSTSKDESELLQEWFDLMRDKTELRRYEKELMVRAKELELEDRHARLQAELRERLENNDNKTEDDVKLEKNIIKEMMDIVSERDSLITVLEEDRQRYTNEDKDLEEQMLAKGLRLTPIQKSTEK